MDDLLILKLGVLYSTPSWKPCIQVGGRINAEQVARQMQGNTGDYLDRLTIFRGSGGETRKKAVDLVGKIADEIKSSCKHDSLGSCLLRSVLKVISKEYGFQGQIVDRVLQLEKDEIDELVNSAISMGVEEVLLGDTASGADGEANTDLLKDIVRVNPFNPDLSYRNGSRESCIGNINELIARFLVVYTGLLVAYLENIEEGDKGDPRVLYEASLAFLEPSWHIADGYMLPFNPRIPLYSFFEKLYAILTAINLKRGGNELYGCLVNVDLAGVQGWIAESKRIRDMWAASWLASWLTWKSIEALVDEYGPDIMVKPPSFPHPFYTARLISRITNNNIQVKLAEILELNNGYPLDPTVPSVALLALPCEQESTSDIEVLIVDSYRRAWKKLLGIMLKGGSNGFPGLKGLYEHIRKMSKDEIKIDDNGFTKKAIDNLDELIARLDELEPPLPIRINVIKLRDIGNEIEKYRGIIGNIVSNESVKDKLKESLLIPIALETKLTSPAGLRARGAGSGEGYLEAARFIHDRLKVINCHSCGTGLAVVYGKELSSIYSEIMKKSEEKRWNRKKDNYMELIRNIGDDSLCPYCLLKRWLREILKSESKSIVGVEMSKEVYRKIGTVTVDAFTTRTKLNYERLKKAVTNLISELQRIEGSEEMAEKIVNTIYSVGVAPVRFLNENDRINLVNTLNKIDWLVDIVDPDQFLCDLESIVIASAHYKSFYTKSWQNTQKIIPDQMPSWSNLVDLTKNAWSTPRRYAFIAADGDFMGKGVLMGRLNICPGDYIRKVLEHSNNASEEVAEKFTGIIEQYDRYMSGGSGSSGSGLTRSLIISLPYLSAVSRALAVETVLERNLIDSHEGMLVYSGGDDLIAVAPPAKKNNGGIELTSIKLAYELRSTYWGLNNQADKGFNTTNNSKVVVPALSVYGRSTVVYFVDNMRPLWTVFQEAHELLEGKDGSLVCTVDKAAPSVYRKAFEKDILVVASDAGGSSVTPISTGPTFIFNFHDKIIGLYNALSNGDLSTSLLYDAEDYWMEYLKLLERGRFQYARMLLERLVSRNASTEARKNEAELTRLLGILSFTEDKSSVQEPIVWISRDGGLLPGTTRWFSENTGQWISCGGTARNKMFTAPPLQMIRLLSILKNAVPFIESKALG